MTQQPAESPGSQASPSSAAPPPPQTTRGTTTPAETRNSGDAPTPPEHNRFYAFWRAIIYATSRTIFRLEVRGQDQIPTTGDVLLVANHASNLDPTTIACGLPRQVHFLAKEELLEAPLLGRFLRRVNTHPIKRGGGDRAAIRQCVDLLRQGHVLLIFPEGTRTPDGNLQEAKPGAAMIASQAAVPIVPIYIDGSYKAMSRHAKVPRPAKIRVRVGQPFSPEDAPSPGESRRDKYDALGRLMLERIAALRP